jgi:hypothetical protein
LGKDADDVYDGEKPGFGLFVVEATDFLFYKECGEDFHRATPLQCHWKVGHIWDEIRVEVALFRW